MTAISLVIPACNEEDAVRLVPDRLFPVLRTLAQDYTVQVVFVDDGSRDGTYAELRALEKGAPCPLVIERHDVNRGLGAALRTGVAAATGDIIVTLDADGTYPFPIVEALVEAIEQGADVATASPYHPDGGVDGVSGLRLLFSRGASLCYRVLVDRGVRTYTAMVRAYRADVLRQSISSNDGFLHVAMTLVEARRRGARITEVPAVLHQREVGVSKAKVWRITRAHLRYMRHVAALRLTRRFWLDDAPGYLIGREVTHHG